MAVSLCISCAKGYAVLYWHGGLVSVSIEEDGCRWAVTRGVYRGEQG